MSAPPNGANELQSDLTIDSSSVLGPPSSKLFETNQKMMEIQKTLPLWSEVGAAKYRGMRERGETPFPGPVLVPDAVDLELPSRDTGRNIPCRLILPDGQNRGEQPGVFLHIHGGGWVLMSEKFQDPFLKRVANETNLAVISVGYRLAPEHPFPAGPHDCQDVAAYLVDNAEKEFGSRLQFVGGESAGGHLSADVVLHLLSARPSFRFQGAILTYGCYNLSSPFPSRAHFKLPLILTIQTMEAYLDAFVPGLTPEQRADPAISPFWHPIFSLDEASLEGRGAEGLPPALFMCGTLDPLLDDSIFMATRWQMAGAPGFLKLFRGMPHGFNMFPDKDFPGSEEAVRMQVDFMKSRIV